jgi:hypothetical protein
MKNCKWVVRLVLPTATLVALFGGSQIASAGTVYDAVADFSIAANPNGQWSYLYDNGSGPQLLTHAVANYGATGVDAWVNGLSGPQAAGTMKNTTASTVTISGTVLLPPNLLNMDPVNNKSNITRWTAPSAGTWSISGLFQGVDIFEKSHTVELLENSTTLLLAPATISSYGQTVNFSAEVSLAKGDTLDFIVNGATVFTDLGTGMSATIQSSSVPEPSSLVLGIIASLACGSLYWRPRRNCDGGRKERRNGGRKERRNELPASN